jgi:hypothetical protein
MQLSYPPRHPMHEVSAPWVFHPPAQFSTAGALDIIGWCGCKSP